MVGVSADERPSFDDSVTLAAQMTGSPMAAITILDDQYQWFKAKVGLEPSRTRRDVAFCRFTVQGDSVMVVADAHADERFVENPLVTASPNIRAYAGMPLITAGGERLGAICVLDTQPRTFTERDTAVLELLAKQVLSQLQLEKLIRSQAEDIFELEAARAELRYMAMHDELTGMRNRRGVIAAIEEQIGEPHTGTSRLTGQKASVLFLDLDNFKSLNDTLGHEVGDQVLVDVAERIQKSVGPAPVVGRFGGDEFVVLVFGQSQLVALQMAEALLRAVEQPIRLASGAVEIEASVGLAHQVSGDTKTLVELIDRADEAVYLSKQLGGRRVSEWAPCSSGRTREVDRHTHRFVQSCLDDNRLIVHYQPIVDLHAGRLARREALLRWTGPGPDGLDVEGFVAAAEKSGSIKEIGVLVMNEACRAAAAWQHSDPGVGVSVNMSAVQITRALPVLVASALQASGLRPELLTLELTETTVLARSDETDNTLERIHELGARLALDDFGTGYASMSMLCALPLDEVKIDRQFCSDPSAAKGKVVRAAVDLGHSLGLCVVAEGVETSEMIDELKDAGCDLGQGYLLGRPTGLDCPSFAVSLVSGS